MDALALLLTLVFALTAFGLRTFVQWRRTGDPGWRLREPGSTPARVARIALGLGFALLVAAPLAAGPGSYGPDDLAVVRLLGAPVAVAGIGLAVLAQFGMGHSWRIGLDPHERTDLVTDGLYRHVRNPIYTGMLLFALGQALLVTNGWSLLAFALVVAGTEVQVRGVEEPYLDATHGAEYRTWASRAGRFVPRVGRVPRCGRRAAGHAGSMRESSPSSERT